MCCYVGVNLKITLNNSEEKFEVFMCSYSHTVSVVNKESYIINS